MTIIQGHRCQRKHKMRSISYSSQLIWIELGIIILSHSINIQGREFYLCDFIKNKQIFNFGLHLDIYRPDFNQSGYDETTKLYISISVWKTLTFIKSHIC